MNDDTTTVPLKGVDAACAACADRLIAGVRSVPGIGDVRLDARASALHVSFDAARVSPRAVTDHADQIAGQLARRFEHHSYRIGGMDCGACAQSIEKSVGALPDVSSATVNFPAARLRVEHAAGAADVPARIAGRVRDLGFTLQDEVASPSDTPRRRWSFSDPVHVGASGALLLLGLVGEHVVRAPGTLVNVVFALGILAGGYRFGVAGVRALKARIVGTNLLMTLAAVGAMVLNQWAEAGAVVFLYALGEALESAAMARTRGSLRALIEAAPQTALVQRGDGSEEAVAADTIVIGDVLFIKPGARIAADGVIIEGASTVSEAAITGESLPREAQSGDAVFAGALNGHGALLVRATAPASDSTLARILHLVEEAQAQKAPVQALVERFGRVYTPLVIASALGLAVVGPLIAPGIDWTYRALTLLVVACPCALVIATPVAFVSGIARAAQNGVLVKGGAFLEALAGARHIALDKTGTLTTGRLEVTDVFAATVGGEEELLAVAGSVERASEHPIADAVVAASQARGLVLPRAVDAVATPGRGVRATLDGGDAALVGSLAFLQESGIALSDQVRAEADRMAAAGRTTLLVAKNGVVLGVLGVADALRPEACTAVAALKRLGLQPIMLTGDAPAVAQTIGTAVGITDVHASLLPQDKLALVREHGKRGIVFVGDGINDAPALAAATIGIAMGAGGAALALEAADIALMKSDLARLPWAVRLARATRSVVWQNIALSLGVVALLLVTTVAGQLSLPLGVLGHEGSALLVILNGLRLLSPRLTRIA